MTLIFEVQDITGRKIHLSVERWKHISSEHPELANNLDEIKQTLIAPLITVQSENDEFVNFYYRQNKMRAEYLLVAVKYLNGKGFIITSFKVKNIRK